MDSVKLDQLIRLAGHFEKEAQTISSNATIIQNVFNYGRKLVQEARSVSPQLARPVSRLWAAIRNFAGNAHQGANVGILQESLRNVATTATNLKDQIDTYSAYPKPGEENLAELATGLNSSIDNLLSATQFASSSLSRYPGGVQGSAQVIEFPEDVITGPTRKAPKDIARTQPSQFDFTPPKQAPGPAELSPGAAKPLAQTQQQQQRVYRRQPLPGEPLR